MEKLHRKTFLPQIISTFDDHMNEFIARKITIRGNWADSFQLLSLGFTKKFIHLFFLLFLLFVRNQVFFRGLRCSFRFSLSHFFFILFFLFILWLFMQNLAFYSTQIKYIAPICLHPFFVDFVTLLTFITPRFIIKFAFLFFQLQKDLTLSKWVMPHWRIIVFEKMGFFEVAFLDVGSRSDFFVSWNAFIIGGVEKRFKTDIIGSSFLGVEDFRVVDENVDNI